MRKPKSLKRCTAHLLNLEADASLLAAFKRVILVYDPLQIGSTKAFKLNSMGLVKYQGNEMVPLCGLYRQYFQAIEGLGAWCKRLENRWVGHGGNQPVLLKTIPQQDRCFS